MRDDILYSFTEWAREQDRRKGMFSLLDEHTDFKERVHSFILREFGDKRLAERLRSLLSAREEAQRIAANM